MEEMSCLIKDTAEVLATSLPLKCFCAAVAAWCFGPTGVQFGPLGTGDDGPHAGLRGHSGHGVHLWNNKNKMVSYNCISRD